MRTHARPTSHAPRQVFLGSLRDAEVERINDRVSAAVMETCLAMTIFRGELSAEFGALFAALTFVKVLHWLAQARVCRVRA